jgi:hypothetical protein
MSTQTSALSEPLEVERSYEPDDDRLRRLLQLLLREPAQTQQGIMLDAPLPKLSAAQEDQP